MKRIKVVLLTLVFALLLVKPVEAVGTETKDLFFSGDDVFNTGIIEGTVFGAGRNIKSDAKINGIFFVAGDSLALEGQSEYLFGAGRNLDLSEKVEKDVFVAGEKIKVTGNIGRNLFVGAATASISGNIKGDVTIFAKEINIDDNALIEGKLKYNDSAQLYISDKAKINGEKITYHDESINREISQREKISVSIGAYLYKVSTLVLIGLVFLWIFPKLFTKLKIQNLPLNGKKLRSNVGLGLLILLLVPMGAIILLLTIIGVPLSLLTLVIYGFGIFLSTIFVGYLLGQWLFKGKQKESTMMIIGIAILVLLKILPVIGEIISFFATTIGLAMGYKLIFLTKKKSD